jgi:hypothetical protein
MAGVQLGLGGAGGSLASLFAWSVRNKFSIKTYCIVDNSSVSIAQLLQL